MPTQPVSDARMFAGRTAILEEMIRSVEDNRSHVIIFGDRGVGKTSLLHMLSQAAREARYIVVYFSCGTTSDFSEMFRSVAADISLLYHSGMSPTSSNSELGSNLSDILPSGKLTPRQFSDAAAKLVGTRVLVVLDEFDRAEAPEFRRDIAELIKTLSDLSARVQLIVAGVADDLVELMEHIPSIRRNIAALRIPNMSNDEVQELIETGQRASGVAFRREAIQLTIAAVHGSPYLASLVCHKAAMIALGEQRLSVERSDILMALDSAIEDFRARMPSKIEPYLDRLKTLMATTDVKAMNAQMKTGETNNADDLFDNFIKQIENSDLFKSVIPEQQSSMLDSLKPYLQLVLARNGVDEDKDRKECA